MDVRVGGTLEIIESSPLVSKRVNGGTAQGWVTFWKDVLLPGLVLWSGGLWNYVLERWLSEGSMIVM